jgi:hypothetical protein
VLLAKKGQVEQARTLLQQAIDTGHPDAAPMAMRALGLLKAVGAARANPTPPFNRPSTPATLSLGDAWHAG